MSLVKRGLIILPLVLFLVCGILLWRGLQNDPREIPSVLINKPVPAFKLPNLYNGMAFAPKDLKGKVSLVNVWATWCAACRTEHNTLMKIGKTVPIYGLDYKDEIGAAREWLRELGNPYKKVGVDRKGMIAIDWGVYGTPETFVVDAKGIIRYKYIGPVTQKVWDKTLKPLVQQLRGQA